VYVVGPDDHPFLLSTTVLVDANTAQPSAVRGPRLLAYAWLVFLPLLIWAEAWPDMTLALKSLDLPSGHDLPLLYYRLLLLNNERLRWLSDQQLATKPVLPKSLRCPELGYLGCHRLASAPLCSYLESYDCWP
jgi:hypothetical protein